MCACKYIHVLLHTRFCFVVFAIYKCFTFVFVVCLFLSLAETATRLNESTLSMHVCVCVSYLCTNMFVSC